jgi:alpha-maltose-1-phosphate synthase
MRVGLLTKEYPPAVYGGAGVHVAELARALDPHVEVAVHCFGEPREDRLVAGTHREWDALAGAAPELAALRTVSADLSMVAATGDVDLVHSHTWYANLAGHLAGLVHEVPHVVTTHSLEPLRPWKREQLGGGYALSSFCERTALEGADAIVAVSEGMRDDVLACYPAVDPDRVTIVHNGVDPTAWHRVEGRDVLAAHGIDEDRPTAVFVGRITRQKGVVHLLDAAAHLPAGSQLVLCAGAPDTPAIATEFACAWRAAAGHRRAGRLGRGDAPPRASSSRCSPPPTCSSAPRSTSRSASSTSRRWRWGSRSSPPPSAASPRSWSTARPGGWCPSSPATTSCAARWTRRGWRPTSRPASPRRSRIERGADRWGLAGRRRVEERFSWEAIATETAALYRRLTRLTPRG